MEGIEDIASVNEDRPHIWMPEEDVRCLLCLPYCPETGSPGERELCG